MIWHEKHNASVGYARAWKKVRVPAALNSHGTNLGHYSWLACICVSLEAMLLTSIRSIVLLGVFVGYLLASVPLSISALPTTAVRGIWESDNTRNTC
jgi:hypothetical protein